jgi:hypothetical protein
MMVSPLERPAALSPAAELPGFFGDSGWAGLASVTGGMFRAGRLRTIP